VFALPGTLLLMIFVLARPQEFVPALQHAPFLHLFAAFALIGYVVDVRLRRLEPIAANTLPWAAAFLVWAIVSTAINAPEQAIPRAIELLIRLAIYGTIAHGIQRFRTFQLTAGVLAATCLFITAILVQQGLAPRQCVGGEEAEGAIEGHADGRACELASECRGPDAEPGLEYRCEHVGLFDTFSVDGRVRYRGELHDPNEVALAISAGGMAMLIAMMIRRRGALARIGAVVGVGAVGLAVFMTQSRGGLVAALLVPAVYAVRRFGLRALIPGAIVAVPVLLVGGRSGDAAELSTTMRYDAWATGLDIFHQHPIFGVGARMFGEHHFITAHNSYVLALAELGFVGLFLFVALLYLVIKTLLVGLRALAVIPGTAAAQVWGLALLAAMAGIVFQINTLSFCYHGVLWIFIGLVGAWSSAVRFHMPSLHIRLTGRDLIAVGAIALGYAFVVLPLFLRIKGFI